jgi:phosphoribosylglycinamide formyltransferase-1
MMQANQKPLRIGVLISGGGTTVLNLLDEIDAGRLNAEIVCGIASKPCSGIDRLTARGVAVGVVPYAQYKPDVATYSAAITERLDAAGVELICLAGFLSPYLFPERYAGKILNIHPALLPKFGGKGMWGHHVHEAVLAAGETESGCTIHYVTEEYDSGPILLQRTCVVLPHDTPDTLADRVFEEERIAYPDAIRLWADTHYPFKTLHQ